MPKNRIVAGYFILLMISLQGCVTIFSDFQSADTLGKGRYEISPAASVVTYKNSSDHDHIQTNLGAQFGYGVQETLDLRLRMEFPTVPGEDFGTFGDYFVLGVGPKFQIVDDKVAGYIPFGAVMGKEINTGETFEVHPTMLLTIPISENIEINPSMKYIYPFSEDRESSFALNLGFAFWQENIGVRPEIGFMKFFENSEGTFIHFGMGFSFRN